MIEKKDIIKMVRHIVRRDKGISDPKIMHPMREWGGGLLVSLLAIVVGGSVSASQFMTYSQDQKNQAGVTESTVLYKAALVESALKLHNEKISIYENISGVSINDVIVTEPPKIQTTSSTNTAPTPVVNNASSPTTVITDVVNAQIVP